MVKTSDVKERIGFIKRSASEILGEEQLENLFKNKGAKKPVVYWGTAPTGSPHVGYFFPALNIANLLKAGFHVKILLADLHAALDNTPWNLVEHRYDYYEKVIPLMIQSIGVDINDLEIVKGSEFQLSPDYMYDVLKLSSMISLHDSRKAASEVVKNIEEDSAKLSGFIYPLMQAMDEVYLKADAQLGGSDQRKIMVLARENLPKIGYEPRIEIMHPLIPGLIGKKMSSSDPNTKVDLIDDEETVKKKLNKAECVEGNPDNGIMAFLKYVVFVLKKDKDERFIIERPEKYGGNLEYANYDSLEKDFISKKFHPLDLKNSVAREINVLLELFRKNSKEIKILYEKAYPNG